MDTRSFNEAPEADYSHLQILATAFRQSALLFAGIELGVFAYLDGEGSTATDVARVLSMDSVPAGLLLNGLASLGVLDLKGGRYRLLPCFRVLAPGANYFGDQLLLHKQQNANWLELANIMRGGHQGPSYESELLQSDRIGSYLDSIEKANRSHADRLVGALRPTIERAERVLDIGGGHGYYARRIVTDTARASVTIMDLDRAIEYAGECLADLLPNPRLEFEIGDALTHTTERAYDMVMVNDLLHYFDAESQREILARAVRALRDEGVIVISKFRLSADGTEPMHASLFSLKMYVNTLRGYLATDQQTVEELQALNLQSVQLLPFGPEKTVLIGRK